MRKEIEKRGLKWNICLDWNLEGNSTLGFLRQVQSEARVALSPLQSPFGLALLTLSAQTAVQCATKNHLHLS